MNNNKKKVTIWSEFSLQKKYIWIITGFVVVVLKIIALIDMFKNYRHIQKKHFILWTLFLILIPPAPIVYFIMTRVPRFEKTFTKSIT